MSTKTLEKLKKEIKQELLREFILPVILSGVKDPEVAYKKDFVTEVLRAVKDKQDNKYNPKTFLRQISR